MKSETIDMGDSANMLTLAEYGAMEAIHVSIAEIQVVHLDVNERIGTLKSEMEDF